MTDPFTGVPTKPGWLSPVASEVWDFLVTILSERHVLSRADGMALELLCSTYALRRAATAAMAESGPATETASGGFKPSPEFVAADRLGKQLLGYLREFGLTPSSRRSATPIVDISRDPLDGFLSNGQRDQWADLIKLP
jgi:P27 family predicted phage terminase small subunit